MKLSEALKRQGGDFTDELKRREQEYGQAPGESKRLGSSRKYFNDDEEQVSQSSPQEAPVSFQGGEEGVSEVRKFRYFDGDREEQKKKSRYFED